VRDHAHVCIPLEREDRLLWLGWASKLKRQIEAAGAKVVPTGHEGGVWIQFTFDPATDRALLDVMHLDDAALERAAVGSELVNGHAFSCLALDGGECCCSAGAWPTSS
jgi:hypothetical protein